MGAGKRGPLPQSGRPQPPRHSGLAFAPAVSYNSGGFLPFSAEVGDLNGDGKLDIVVANSCDTFPTCANGSIGVLLNHGDGSFGNAVIYGSGGSGAQTVAGGDFNGDHIPDLVVTNPCESSVDCSFGTVGVLLGNGDGTFQPAITYNSGGHSTLFVTVTDLNHDGKADLVTSSQCEDDISCVTGGVAVLFGNGDGTFQSAQTYSSGGYEAQSAAVADLNGDGQPDIVVTNICQSTENCTIGSVAVLLGNADGTFQAAISYGLGGFGGLGVAVADVNNDGRLDLVVANSNAGVDVLLGNGDGTFQAPTLYSSAYGATDVAVADVDGDGVSDLVVSYGYGLYVLLGTSSGTFQAAQSFPSGKGDSQSVAIADLNGDGKPDVVVANECAVIGCTDETGTAGVFINTSKTVTSTVLTSSPNPSAYGQTVTLTATVTIHKGFSHGSPTGKVAFFDGINNLGSSDLNSSGVALLLVSSLAVGTHSITATYNGDVNFATSTSTALSQEVQGAIVALSPTQISFGNQTVGTTSTPQSVTLTNTGNVNLDITTISVGGANSADYGQTNNCGSSLPPGGTCAIIVTFTPSADGSRSAAIRVSDNASGSPQSVTLTGVGVSPTVSLSQTALTFPTTVVFTSSPTQNATLTNTGLGILTVSSIVASSPFLQTNTCGTSVAPGASCTITVRFKPATKGQISGSVGITDNASNSPQRVKLSGVATFIQTNPTSENFGNQPVGTTSVARQVIVSNKGNSSVSISSIAITGTDAGDFAGTNTCGTSLASGASCKITMTFTPSAKGKRTANVTITDNGGGSPQLVALSGTGT
jgi:hypothetical protein